MEVEITTQPPASHDSDKKVVDTSSDKNQEAKEKKESEASQPLAVEATKKTEDAKKAGEVENVKTEPEEENVDVKMEEEVSETPKEETKEEAPKPTATTEAPSSPVKSPAKVPDPPAVEDTESGTTSEAGKKVEVESAKVGSPQPLPPPTGKLHC